MQIFWRNKYATSSPKSNKKSGKLGQNSMENSKTTVLLLAVLLYYVLN